MERFNPRFVPKKMDKEIVSIRLPIQTLEIIDAKAAEIGISRNQFLNQCIEYALSNMADSDDEPQPEH